MNGQAPPTPDDSHRSVVIDTLLNKDSIGQALGSVPDFTELEELEAMAELPESTIDVHIPAHLADKHDEITVTICFKKDQRVGYSDLEAERNVLAAQKQGLEREADQAIEKAALLREQLAAAVKASADSRARYSRVCKERDELRGRCEKQAKRIERLEESFTNGTVLPDESGSSSS